MGLLQYILSFFSLLYIFLPDPSFSSLIISSAMSNLMLRPETEFLNSVTVIVKFESQFWFSESFPFVKYIFQQVTFASNTSSIPLICWYTSDTSRSGSVIFLLVLFVVTLFLALLVACWTLCLENHTQKQIFGTRQQRWWLICRLGLDWPGSEYRLETFPKRNCIYRKMWNFWFPVYWDA